VAMLLVVYTSGSHQAKKKSSCRAMWWKIWKRNETKVDRIDRCWLFTCI